MGDPWSALENKCIRNCERPFCKMTLVRKTILVILLFEYPIFYCNEGFFCGRTSETSWNILRREHLMQTEGFKVYRTQNDLSDFNSFQGCK